MLKALMIITMVSGTEYTAKLPSMDQCLQEAAPVESQVDVKSASCIPRTEESKIPTDLFGRWLDVVLMLEEQKEWGEPCPVDLPNYWDSGEDYYPPKP
jgi:hypothetical protein